MVNDPYVNTTHRLNLTGGQISTILYIMEGYIQGNDDYDEDSEFYQDCNSIFAELQSVTDNYYAKKEEFDANDVQECITNGTDYRDCVDHLIDSMEASE